MFVGCTVHHTVHYLNFQMQAHVLIARYIHYPFNIHGTAMILFLSFFYAMHFPPINFLFLFCTLIVLLP